MRSSMDDTFALTDIDLLDKNAGRRFLDFYGDAGIRLGLERYGFVERLLERGWTDLRIEAHALDDRHTLLIDGTAEDGTEGRLIELVVRRDRLRIEGFERIWDVLTVDWLSLRNPLGEFTPDRMRLPGQDAPGLGIGERVLELLYRLVSRLDLDGLVNVAEYFHNAALYSREMVYADPWYQGQLEALEELLFWREGLTFPQAAWAVHWGHVRDEGEPFCWRGEALVGAREETLKEHLHSRDHRRRARQVRRALDLTLEREAFDAQWERDEGSLLEAPTQPG